MNTTNNFKTLAICLLDDEDGITQYSYQALHDLAKELRLNNWFTKLNEQVQATDGRFYLPTGHTMNDID